jgi:superfamily II DNA or RNA helicase
MRVGKTLIALQHLNRLYIERMNLRVLVVVPKLSIIKSWKDEATKFGLEHLSSLITFSTYLSLNKQDLNYDIIVLDEAHNLLPSHDEHLSKFKGEILGLTGTPPRRENSEKGRLFKKHCPIIYNYLTETAITDNILNDYRIIVHMISLNDKKTLAVNTKNGGKFFTSEQDSYNYWTQQLMEANTPQKKQMSSIMRMKAMMGFTSKQHYTKDLLTHIDEKCIVFCNTKDQADAVCAHTYHSTNKEEENEKTLELFKLGIIDKLSCVLQISEGITIPGLRVIVMQHTYGNEKKFAQRFGRCLGLSAEEIATVHLMCYENTQDEVWVKSALQDLDQSKIRYIRF